jgi:hypothetical protein
MGGNVAYRMTSLLTAPFGRGTRNNDRKRQYVSDNIANLEYRTLACIDRKCAQGYENELKARKSDYEF